ncbi:MAG: ABC transporter ATP-binding protein [Betaproteobacteria bacterium]|nr:ABC transporter ATP-binding protein [Betaproteobacteria bacterium]
MSSVVQSDHAQQPVLLQVRDLKVHFRTDAGILHAVDGIDFHIHRAETLGVVGESGCGKSVTAMAIMKLLAMPPGFIAGGEIRFADRDLLKLDSGAMRKVRSREIAMIFQEPMTSLNPVFSVGEQIAEALRLHEGLSQRQAIAKTIEMLALVNIPKADKRVYDYPHQFSGGMRQRVMIAMALACNPKLLIADEPTTALDVTIQAQILDLLNRLKEQMGMAIMLITHAMGVVAETTQRVIVMYAGKVVEEAPVEQLFREPLHPYTQGLIGSIPRIDHAVDGVSFDLHAGETLGLVGESGCGKSTTGRCILRLIEPSHGQVWFDNREVTAMDKASLRATCRDMQIIFQDPFASLNPRMTVENIIGEALSIHRLAKTREAYEERIVSLLETVGLHADHRRRFPHEFSGGQRQRIGIARALAVSPKLIVCDEPVSALDVSIQAQVINLLEDLQAKFGLTYLFIAHDLSVVEHISNRVAVMYLGRIVEIAAARALYTDPRHPYTEALLSAVPIPDPTVRRKRIVLTGDVPNPINPPKGCHFHPRCPKAMARCREEAPMLKDLGQGHLAACHLND